MRSADDEELFDLEDSEGFSYTSDDSESKSTSQCRKRRKSTPLTTERATDSDEAESYDEDEIALQQAIALSVAGNCLTSV